MNAIDTNIDHVRHISSSLPYSTLKSWTNPFGLRRCGRIRLVTLNSRAVYSVYSGSTPEF